MRLTISLFLALAVAAPATAQLLDFDRDRMIKFTPHNPYERFPDGRPKVPDSLLERVKSMSVEEAWGALRSKGYPNQYAGGFQILHPGQKLVGRAYTALYLPEREDVSKIVVADAVAAGEAPGDSQRSVDRLQLNDVPVVSLMGAAEGHNFGGDNIHAALYGITRTGAVVDGTIRDLEGTFDIPTQIYFRQAHPAAVSGVTAVAYNIPIEIGGAFVMPGDVVLGDRTGVVFIPPHLVEQIVEAAEATQYKDEWRKQKFLSGEFKASDLYGATAKKEAVAEMEEYSRRKLEELRKKR